MTPDVVIVGAGLAGLSLAWHLAPHSRVVVVDQAPTAGAEATSHNAGLIRRMGEDPVERALAVRTAAWMADPGPRWSRSEASHPTGAVMGLAIDGHHLHDAAAHLRARGVAVSVEEAPVERAPALAGSPLVHAWWLPDERTADPATLVAGLLEGLGDSVTLRLGVRVTGLRTVGSQVCGVDTTEGPIDAARVAIAAGAWAQSLVAPLGLARPLIPLRRALIRTAPHALSRPDHPWVWIDDVGVYARPDGDGWLLCGCDESVDWPMPGPGSRGAVSGALEAAVMDKVRRYLPSLADARPVARWTGLRTFAPDRRPLLGADPDASGLWWAAGLGGFGVTGGYAAGEAVAHWMLERDVPWLSARAVSPGRPHLRRWSIRPHGDLGTATLIDVAQQLP
ncbi:MAG: FAD-binding oxidoreductase [Myxococcales bacterium]|nr:FAD-binding oxidoreductase [Myxococcales bacterium]